MILKRIGLWLLVNILIVALVSVIFLVFDLEPYAARYGINFELLIIYSLVWGMAGSLVSLFMSKQLAKWSTKMKVIKIPANAQEQELVTMITRIAQSKGMLVPEIGIYPSKEVNAFATGWSKKHSLVGVSAGLLQNMTPDETEGVMAHEMAHIQNGDMITMTLLQGVINAFVIFLSRVVAFAAVQVLGENGRKVGPLLEIGIIIALQIVFGLLGSLIVFWYSRKREYAADYGSAQSVGKSKMILALQALQRIKAPMAQHQEGLETMKINGGPVRKNSIKTLFRTHPDLDDRIRALQMAPIG